MIRIPFILVPVVLILSGPAFSQDIDYVVIYPSSLNAEVSELFAHRTSQGLRVWMIDTEFIRINHGGGILTDSAIRDYVEEIVEDWPMLPTYLLLIGDVSDYPGEETVIPSHFEGTTTIPHDSWFVRPTIPAHKKPVMQIGRIPVRSLNNYGLDHLIDKIVSYESASQASWMSSIHQLVGDTLTTAQSYEPEIMNLANVLWDDFMGWNPSETRQLRSNYSSMTSAEQALRSRWNQGAGVIHAFGQTVSGPILLNCVDFQNSFVSTIQANDKCPIIIGGSCNIAAFQDDSFPVPGGVNTGATLMSDDLLLGSAHRGAVAIIGASGLVHNYESFLINREILGGLAEGNLTLGAVFSKAKIRCQEEGLGIFPDDFDDYNLLGDPAMLPRVAVQSAARWQSGFEVEDPFVWQNKVRFSNLPNNPGVKNSRIRNVMGAPEGERIFEISCNYAGAPGIVEWDLAQPSFLIGRNSILSAIYKMSGPGGISINGITTDGVELRLTSSIVYQDGSSLSPSSQSSMPWHVKYADLSALTGRTLQSISVRYEGQGTVVGSMDQVRLLFADPLNSFEEVLNGSFEEGSIALVQPTIPVSYWDLLPDNPAPMAVIRGTEHASEGKYSILLRDITCTGQGIGQIVHASRDIPAFTFRVDAYSGSESSIRLRVRDAATNGVLNQFNRVLHPGWSSCALSFYNPGYPSQSSRIRVELIPGDCVTPIYVDNASLLPQVQTSAETPLQKPGWIKSLLVSPNPLTASERQLNVLLTVATKGRAELALYYLHGRLRTSLWSGTLSAGENVFSVPFDGFRLVSGLYFVSVKLEERTLGAHRILVLH